MWGRRMNINPMKIADIIKKHTIDFHAPDVNELIDEFSNYFEDEDERRYCCIDARPKNYEEVKFKPEEFKQLCKEGFK